MVSRWLWHLHDAQFVWSDYGQWDVCFLWWELQYCVAVMVLLFSLLCVVFLSCWDDTDVAFIWWIIKAPITASLLVSTVRDIEELQVLTWRLSFHSAAATVDSYLMFTLWATITQKQSSRETWPVCADHHLWHSVLVFLLVWFWFCLFEWEVIYSCNELSGSIKKKTTYLFFFFSLIWSSYFPVLTAFPLNKAAVTLQSRPRDT